MLVRKRAAISLLLAIAAVAFVSPARPIAAQAPGSLGSVSLAIEPSSKEVVVGEEFTLIITVAPSSGQQIDGVQVFLDYQPEFLEVIDVTPGTALPLTLWCPPYFDNTTGQVRYAAGAFSNFPSSTFTLAALRLKALKATPETWLSFVFSYEIGRATKVTWEGENLTCEPVIHGKVMITEGKADFTAEPTSGIAPLEVKFTDKSRGTIENWEWDFGDGTTAEWAPETRPEDGILSHTYAAEGAYTVSLTVSNPTASDTETRVDYILVIEALVWQSIVPDSECTVETPEGVVAIEFPAGAVTSETEVIIREHPVSDAPSAPSGFRLGDTYFSIEGITTLAREITITVKYSDRDVAAAGGNPNLLTLSRYDEDAGEWVVLPTTVDTAAQTLTVTTDKLSMWMVMVEEAPTEPAEEPLFILPLWTWLVIVIAVVLLVGIVAGYRLARR